MRAVVVHEFGPVDSHRIEEIAAPRPQPGEVVIDVHAIGVNFPDTLMVQGLYQKKPARPFTPGRDAAGVISAVGDGVSRFKPGDRVTALVTYGAYAEQCLAPESRCFLLPEGMDFVTAAGMTAQGDTRDERSAADPGVCGKHASGIIQQEARADCRCWCP